jgi:radical SAM superfamily enzyme YgiQ (UPF0313 family)
MPKILFIQPTQYDPQGRLCKQTKIYLPGLVFPLLAAMTPPHWEVEVKLEVVDDIDFETDADIVGIGTMGFATLRGMEISREFRKRGKITVMGGYMASMMPEETLRCADSLILGDAEISYPLMLKDFEEKGRIERLYDHPIEKLEGLPVPRYEFLTSKPIGDMLPVQAGRGCPNYCSFCSIACIYKGRYIFRPVSEVIRDIKAVRDLGFKKFYLIDDNMVANEGYLRELCREIEPLGMQWATQCALKLGDNKELLELVHRSGARIMSFGIESINQEGLDKLNKSWLKVEDHKKRIKDITDAGILVTSEMIIGTDSDTEQTIKATYDFVQEARLPLPRFYILTPTPGSDLYDEFKAANRLTTEDWKYYDGSVCVFRPQNMSAEKLTELFWWLYRKVYSWKSILRRTLFHPAILRFPMLYIYAFLVSLHYRKYVIKKVPPNIL